MMLQDAPQPVPMPNRRRITTKLVGAQYRNRGKVVIVPQEVRYRLTFRWGSLACRSVLPKPIW
jgi:hypothetical protein